MYEGTNELMALTGFVPRKIIMRLKSIGESGIWDWWLQYVTGGADFKKLNSVNPPTQAGSMKGNLIILFCVWMAGLGISTMVFGLI